MAFTLPPLPFAKNALAPHLSEEAVDLHYERHHRTYVNKLNELVVGSAFETATLERIIQAASGKIFNNGAQVWNHTFFWNCLTPGGSAPTERLKDKLENHFGTLEAFKLKFSKKAEEHFGSGWTWLSADAGGNLSIDVLTNAGNPMRQGKTPLLALDVWEHAYYVDYKNERGDFIDAFWELVNWDFVAKNLQLVSTRSAARRAEERPAAH